MKVTFLSLDDDNNKVYFTSDYSKVDDQIVFLDKSTPNTEIHLKIKDEEVILERIGSVNMQMIFNLKHLTKGFYNNDMGLDFNFQIKCHKLLCRNKKVNVEYDLILEDGQKLGHKFSLLFN